MLLQQLQVQEAFANDDLYKAHYSVKNITNIIEILLQDKPDDISLNKALESAKKILPNLKYVRIKR